MPGLTDLEPIPFHELFVRLCYKFNNSQEDPDVDAQLQGGSREDIDDAMLDTLALYLHFADVIYEAGTEEQLLQIIKEKGELRCCVLYRLQQRSWSCISVPAVGAAALQAIENWR